MRRVLAILSQYHEVLRALGFAVLDSRALVYNHHVVRVLYQKASRHPRTAGRGESFNVDDKYL